MKPPIKISATPIAEMETVPSGVGIYGSQDGGVHIANSNAIVRLTNNTDVRQEISRSGGGLGFGRMAISWDDGYVNWYTVLKPFLDQYPEQKHTFFLTTSFLDTPGYLSTAQALELHEAGHELGAHSHTHMDFLTATPEQRAAEHDAMLTAWNAKGLPPIQSFAYPFGTRNHTTDAECYLRYPLVFDVSSQNRGKFWGTRFLSQMGKTLCAPRQDFGLVNFDEIPELVLLCKRSPILLHIYSHQFSQQTIQDKLVPILNAARNLGVPILRASDATPHAYHVNNAGFENGVQGWDSIVTNGYTMESVLDTPQIGFNGVRSLRLTGTSNTGSIRAIQHLPCEPGVEYTLSCRVRNETSSGAGRFCIRLLPSGHLQTSIGPYVESAPITSTTWTQATVAFTPPANCHQVIGEIYLENRSGNAFADHVYWGPTAYGVLG
jgi:hypothetical protein